MDFIINSTNEKLVEFNDNFIYLYEFENEYYVPLNKILQAINKEQYLEEVLNSGVFKLGTKQAFNTISKEKITIIKTSFLNLVKLKFGIDINFEALQSFNYVNNKTKEISECSECSKVIFNQEERIKINNFVRKLCRDNRLNYQRVWSNIYNEIERRKGCDLNLKLQNLRTQYINQGRHKKINKLDVIFSDPKLIRIYQSVINDMGIGRRKVTY